MDYYDLYLIDHPQDVDYLSDSDNEESGVEMLIKDSYDIMNDDNTFFTIDEADEENDLSSTSSRNNISSLVKKATNDFGTFNMTKEEAEKRFLSFLKSRELKLRKDDLANEILDKMDFNFNEFEVQDVLNELARNNKRITENIFKNKDTFEYDVERLKQENLILKKQRNYDRAMIRLLKIEIYKNSIKDNMSFSKKTESSIGGDTKKIEDYIAENKKLKQKIHEISHEFKVKYSRVIHINSELTKMLNSKKLKIQQKLEKTLSEHEKSQAMTEKEKELTQKIATLRIKINELYESNAQMKEKIIAKDLEIAHLKSALEGKSSSILLKKAEDLEKLNEKLIKKTKILREKMSIENQIRVLFPKSHEFVDTLLKAAYDYEKKKFTRETYRKTVEAISSSIAPVKKSIESYLKKGIGFLYYSIGKKYQYMPIIREFADKTMNLWTKIPSLESEKLAYCEKEIDYLRTELDRIKKRLLIYEGDIEQKEGQDEMEEFRQYKRKKHEEGQLEKICSIKLLDKTKEEWDSIPESVKKYIRDQDREILKLYKQLDKKLKLKKKDDNDEDIVDQKDNQIKDEKDTQIKTQKLDSIKDEKSQKKKSKNEYTIEEENKVTKPRKNSAKPKAIQQHNH